MKNKLLRNLGLAAVLGLVSCEQYEPDAVYRQAQAEQIGNGSVRVYLPDDCAYFFGDRRFKIRAVDKHSESEQFHAIVGELAFQNHSRAKLQELMQEAINEAEKLFVPNFLSSRFKEQQSLVPEWEYTIEFFDVYTK